ncbi:hypothetical protein EVAR_33965_1 [Eumeta japonica]|uniref:Uncharacterized protein n=1 Tax=Eumeta variegata TaxID=151549 RepID=A0A4C1X3G4_EUMVA|nr:hypothetical protein EVAR_33965_1 [Eumeta japonica]
MMPNILSLQKGFSRIYQTMRSYLSEEKNNNEENVDDCDERAEAGRAGSKTPLGKYTRRCKRDENCEKGTIIACHSGDVMVLDAKILSMISTFHDNSTYTGTSAGEECEKPICKRL